MKLKFVKFRYYDIDAKKYVYSDDYGLSEFFRQAEMNANGIINEYTGLRDKHKVPIYRGDYVKFKYHVGDFAWESMDTDEADCQRQMIGKIYIGIIDAHIISGNLQIVCGDPIGTHIIFPLVYAEGSEVIGNEHENNKGDLLMLNGNTNVNNNGVMGI